MNNCPSVSIIILTYYPNISNLNQTIASAIRQKEVDFEIVISDDGTGYNFFDEVRVWFQTVGFEKYKLVQNKVNSGTVQNCYIGLSESSGEYVFMTSPGDLLYDEYAMRDFYKFAKKNNANLCFGNGVYYNDSDQDILACVHYNLPIRPSVFADKYSDYQKKTAFFFGNFVLGATYFRKRETALNYIGRVRGLAKYTEDTTSTLFALAENERLYYYDRSIVFYEYGSGISTNKENKWKIILDAEIDSAYKTLAQLYPTDSIIQAAYLHRSSTSRWKKMMHIGLKYPRVFVNYLKCKSIPTTNAHNFLDDTAKYEEILSSMYKI